uniref:Uncharacterized protein n=1 Tax=Anguilla anguilla TaxID=7936 RepID=A0A0E9VRX8_ANGAN
MNRFDRVRFSTTLNVARLQISCLVAAIVFPRITAASPLQCMKLH